MTTAINMETDQDSYQNIIKSVSYYRSYIKNKEQYRNSSQKSLSPSNILSQLQLRFLHGEDIVALKELCSEWFPIKYPDSWYNLIAFDKRFYSLAATVEQKIIAVLIAEIKPRWQVPKEDGDLLSNSYPQDTNVAYILSLGVHKPYRRQGVASYLLNNFLESICVKENKCYQEIKAIYLHVLSSNKAAIQFYEQHKFQKLHFLPSYYLIDGSPKDGFSYVLHVNGGKPPATCLEYFLKSYEFLCYLNPFNYSNRFFHGVNNLFRYFIAWRGFSPFVSKARQCRNL